MATRTYRRLTVAAIRGLAKVPGLHPDGDGLGLQVTKAGVASWTFRYMLDRREHCMGLGPLRSLTLAQARLAADDARRLKREGVDPIAARRAKQRDEALAAARAMTFRQCGDAYAAAYRAGWSPKHAAQFDSSLAAYVYPVFGDVPVQAVDVALVMRVLEPVWNIRAETASRVRGRIESILDWAAARGHRSGDNPARWRGHLENLLPARNRVQQVEHHAALPHAEIGAFVADLRRLDSVAARALEFLILTASRTGEAVGAKWVEVDLKNRIWTIPAARMKAGKEHRVPLSDAALAIVEAMSTIRTCDFVFPGGNGGTLGKMQLPHVLRRLKGGITTHGFRASFRSWAADQRVSHEVAEMVLGHSLPSAVLKAYQRSDLFEQRRRVMSAWARYCAEPEASGAKVVAIATLR